MQTFASRETVKVLAHFLRRSKKRISLHIKVAALVLVYCLTGLTGYGQDLQVTGDLGVSADQILGTGGIVTGYSLDAITLAKVQFNVASYTVPIGLFPSDLNGQSEYWSSPLIWNNPVLGFSNLVNVSTTVVNATEGTFSVQAVNGTIDTLEGLGPTEKNVSVNVPFLADLTGGTVSASAGLTLKFDVTLDSGANVVMDQSNVTLQNLTVATGATLSANSTLDTRADLINHGIIYNLGGTIEGNFVNDSTPAEGTAVVVNAPLTVEGNFTNTGSMTIGPGGALYRNGAAENEGTMVVDGDAINFNGVYTNTGTTSVTSGWIYGALANYGTLELKKLGVLGGPITNAGTFNWSGGVLGNLTNTSATMILSGSDDKIMGSNLGTTLTNNGTIVQTGTGALVLYYNGDPIELNNCAGGLYDIQSDGGLRSDSSWGPNYFYISDTVNNAGTFRKSGGIGTSNVEGNIVFNNTGTVEVSSGTLQFHCTVSQFSGNTLSGGTWMVENNATLSAPFANSFTTNQGKVTLSGANSVFANINSLADNQGSFAILNGRNFDTVGNLQNSGQLMTGQGSELTVNGNLTLLTASSLTFELGGVNQGSDYGFMVVNGSVSLAGTLTLNLVNGFESQLNSTDTFTLLMASSPLTGSFSNVGNGALLNTSDGLFSFYVNYGADSPFGADSIVLSEAEAIPEPTTWMLLGMSLVMLFLWRRNKLRDEVSGK